VKTAAALILGLALPLGTQEDRHEPHGDAPGPRAAIEGLSGVRCRSTLDFGGAKNHFEALYVFPDRARWVFEALDRSSRVTIYRSGPRVYQVASGPSTEMEDAGRDTVVLQMELRRAALLWPRGFDWQPHESERRAAVHLSTCCPGEPIGTLVATGFTAGRPARIEARNGEGVTIEAIEILGWKEHGDSPWPERLRVSGGSGAFEESVEELDTRVRYLDLAFLPGDRRGRPAGDPSLMAGERTPSVSARFVLPRGLDWEAARARADELFSSLRERLGAAGPDLDPVPSFELDGEGHLVACRIRLRTVVAAPPQGFEPREGGAGLFLFLTAPEQLTGAALTRLRGAVPADATGGTAYVRFHPGRVEVVLPLEPR
jgi:hypothetical protein